LTDSASERGERYLSEEKVKKPSQKEKVKKVRGTRIVTGGEVVRPRLLVRTPGLGNNQRSRLNIREGGAERRTSTKGRQKLRSTGTKGKEK